MQTELTGVSSLLGESGELNQVGWARRPLLDCNLEAASFCRFRSLQRFRIKRWDYYGLTTPDFYFSAALAHLGYAGLVFAYVLDFTTGDFHEETVIRPFGRGIELARNSDKGDSRFDNGRVRVAFRLEGQARRLQLDWPSFRKKQGLAADLTFLHRREHESMTIVIPIGHRRFYYNRKINCLPAQGWVEMAGRHMVVSAQKCLGNLDWGRGVWDYSSFWVWASASSFQRDGRTLGLNLGYGFGDTSAATENAIILDGRVHKLGDIRFSHDPEDLMKPWRMSSPDGRLDLESVPFKERVARSNLLLVTSTVHQMFGRYSGALVTDEGETINVAEVVGFAEEHLARW
jgi:hypothetical protein